MLSSLKEFKFYQAFRLNVEEKDDVRFLVELTDENGDSKYLDNTKLMDISVKGMGFSSPEKLTIGEEIDISLQYKKDHIDLTGKVVRSISNIDDKEGESLIYGIEIEEDKELKKFIAKFINGFSIERLKDSLTQSALMENKSIDKEGFEIFSLLLSLMSDISKFGEKKEFVTNMLDEVTRVLDAQRASLFLINADTNELESVAALGVDVDYLKFDYRLGIAGSVFTTGISLNIDTRQDKSRFNEKIDEMTGFETKSIICHPLHNREDKIIGVIEVLNKRNSDRFSIEDEKAMKVISLVFSSLFHNFNPISESSMVRRFSTPFDREYALIGDSDFIGDLRRSIIKLKDLDEPLLIEGEDGSGKHLYAKIIHFEGKRGLNQYDIINVAQENPETLETEIFGSGAKQGKIELCSKGTLVIKNVCHLDLNIQKRLYNLFLGKEKIGNNVDLNTRLIFTSKEHLPIKVAEGKFHQGLYELISTSYVEIMPLRKRKDDLELLINYFIKLECIKHGYLLKNFSEKAMGVLEDYDWPGNVAELKKCVERSVLYNPKNHIISNVKNTVTPFFDKKKSASLFNNIPDAEDSSLSLKDRIAIVERKMILFEIKKHDGNKSKAAKAMGISREALRKKLLASDEVIKTLKKSKTNNVVDFPTKDHKKAA